MLERRYDAIIANPTANDKGTNIPRAAPCMKNEEMKTAKMHNIASKRGTTVSSEPSRTARATGSPFCKCAWIFSIDTVASSTKMPMANANPPSVIRLIVWPVNHNATIEQPIAKGIFNTTTKALRQSRRNTRIIKPTKTAPMAPSLTTLRTARVTNGD